MSRRRRSAGGPVSRRTRGAYLKANVNADEIDRTGEIPAVRQELARMGAYGIKVPREYGGLGFSQTTYCRACMLIASHCMNVFSHLSVHQSVGVAQPILLFGTEAQKRQFLPRVGGRGAVGFALTENTVGSDPARLRTEAVPDGRRLLINGEKLWCSNGTEAGLLIVAARRRRSWWTASRARRSPRLSSRPSAPGIEVVHRCQFMGLHALYNGVIRFTNVRVPQGQRRSGARAAG
jgi:alkylation response protein AidB-like acyl-CoA dehydrogenase